MAGLYAQARDGFKRQFGHDHPHAAAAISQLAAIALEQREPGRTRRLAEDALARRRASRGEQHPDSQASSRALASLNPLS